MDKFHSILELLKENQRKGLTSREIAEILEFPPSTCYRMLSILRSFQYVQLHKPENRYRLGPALLRMAETIVENLDDAIICLPYLEKLHYELGESTLFARFNGEQCITVEICGFTNTDISLGRGEVMPFHCAATAKAVLAFRPPQERTRLISKHEFTPFTSNTITDPDTLIAELEEIRITGIAFNFAEMHEGINSMAAPVFDQAGVKGAVAVIGPADKLDVSRLKRYSKLFVQAGIKLSSDLRGEFPSWIAHNYTIQPHAWTYTNKNGEKRYL